MIIKKPEIGNYVKVHAPAGVGNIVCGFDVLGLVLNNPYDVMELKVIDESKVTIFHHDDFGLPVEAEKNVAGVTLLSIINETKLNFGFELHIHKNIKPGSGIGSSAASAAGAAVAANILLGNPFDLLQTTLYAMKGEFMASGGWHADNIAPCIYGGVTLIRSNEPLDIVPIPAPDLFVTVIHPQIEVKTSYARQILKPEVALKDAVTQWANVGGLIAGFFTKDTELIRRSLVDVVVEPVRSALIPSFYNLKNAALSAGALGGGISGSGPSVFMLSESLQKAEQVEKAMRETYTNTGIPFNTYITTINKSGVEVIEKNF